jgi:TatA/E family protein of Tat protein translocase
MFGSIGGAELLVILLLALLLFGPRKLPEIGRSIGRALSQFRSASHEFKSSLEREAAIDATRGRRDELRATGAECSTHEPAAPAKP